MMSIILTIVIMALLGQNVWGSTATEQGKELYRSYGCALCHGMEGHGNGINAQRFNPPPTNFEDLKTYLHGSDQDSIRRSIQYGIKEDSSIMPSFDHIPPDELDKIIAYLKSLQEKGMQ